VGEDFYTVEEAAKILKLTPGRVRQLLRAGELEGGIPPEESGGRGWKIPMHAVHDRDRPARVERSPEAPESPERLSDLEAEVRDLRYQLGLSRGRIEITEKAESTLRNALDREITRAAAERERAEKLQAELDRARLPWYRKLFGG
jgi:excisionase family DNA binding protein